MSITYKSKIGLELVIPISLIFGICSYELIVEKIWMGIVFMFSIWGFIMLIGLTLRYKFDENTLTTRYGFIVHQKIPIEKIRKINETNNILSAPAFSLDRIEIWYNKFDSVMISPRNKTAFIVHLTKVNPRIEVKLKEKKSSKK